MAEPQPTTAGEKPALKVGDTVIVRGRVLNVWPGDFPEIKDGVQVRFDSTIPRGATVVVLPQDIVAAVPPECC